MRNQTLKRFNILTVLLLVLAIAITCCAFYIGNGVKSVVDGGSNGKQVDMSIADNAILSDTNGSIPEGEELVIPDGYTGVAITNQDELKAFLTDTDTVTLKYGYLQPADDAEGNPTNSISIDWAANGSTASLTANKIFDGRGYSISLDTVGTADGNFNRQTISADGSLIGKDVRAGGMFVTSNYGVIKNVKFDFAKAVSFKCNQEWTTTYGIITGYNIGVIENVSLDIKTGATFKVDKNEPSEATDSTDRCTVLVGAVAGTNGGSDKAAGIVNNVTVNNNGNIWAQARYKGNTRSLIGRINGSSRSSIALLIGRMQGTTTLVNNCVITGKGSISASTDGSNNKGTVYRNVATAIAANGEYGGSQDSAFGTINGIIDAFTGTCDASTSGSQGGTFDCANNFYNVYRAMDRSTAKKIVNCGDCGGVGGHSKTNTYRTIESKNVEIQYGFSANVGELNYNTKLTAEQTAAGVKLFEHKTSTSAVSNNVVTPTYKTIKTLYDNISVDTTGTLAPDTSESKTFGSVAIKYYDVELEMTLSNIGAAAFNYTGNAQVPTFDVGLTEKASSNAYTVNTANIKKTYTKDGAASEDSILPGSYKVEVKDTANAGAAYYEEKDGKIYAAKFVAENCSVDYVINKASITTNAPEDKWYNDFTYSIDMTNFASGAMDKMEYSIDGGEWVSANAITLKASTNGDAVVYKFRGYKGTVLVTEEYEAAPIKFDNVAPTITDLVYSKDVTNWTVDDIITTFKAADATSNLKNLVVTNGTETFDATQGTGEYTFKMNKNVEYVLTVTDNAGNTAVSKVTPKIDQTEPTLTLAPTYYTPDGEVSYTSGETSYSPITINANYTVGNSGIKVYIAEVTDGAEGVYDPIAAVNGKYFKKYTDETQKTLRIKIVNGAGVEKTEDINIVISRHRLTITNSNLKFAENALTKTYDGKTNVTGSISLQNLMDNGSVALDEKLYSHFTVTAEYDNKNVSTGKTVKYKLTVAPAYEAEYIIDNQLADTVDGVIVKKDIKLTINQQTREYYDANPAQFSYSFEGIINNEDSEVAITLMYDANDNSDIGSYAIKLVGQVSNNYNVVLASENEELDKLIITRRSVIVEFTNYAGLTYNGQEQSLAAFFTDFNGEKQSLTVTYDKAPINAGIYVATAHFPEDSNYKSSIGDSTWTFKIAKKTAEIKSENVNTDFDGTAKSIYYEVENDLPVTVTYNKQAELPINAGRYVVEITCAGDDNYNPITREALLVINKITFKGVVGFENKTVTYNGNVHSLVVTNLPEGTHVVYVNNDQTNVGTYSVKATIKNINYFDFDVQATLTINKMVFTGLKFESLTTPYNGKVQSIAVVGVPEGATVTYSTEGLINVSNTKVFATISGDNYETVIMEAHLNIVKAALPSDIKFDTEDSEFIYDGVERVYTLLGDLTGLNVKYRFNVVSQGGITTVFADITSENYVNTTLSLDVNVKKMKVDVIYNNVPENLMIKPNEPLPTITAYYIDINGKEVYVDIMISGDIAEDGIVEFKPIMNRNYEATDATSTIYIEVDEEGSGMSTGAIIGASVGGSVGGLAVIGGIVAFVLIKKKKSIV